MKEFILQKDCDTCKFITMANAYISKYDINPFPKYYSKEWFDMVLEVGNDEESFQKNIPSFSGIEYIKLFAENARHLKKKIIEEIKKGNYIDFTIYKDSLHSCLLIDYDNKKDSFKVINAKFYTSENVVEYLPFEILIGSRLMNKNGRYSLARKNCNFNITKMSYILAFKANKL